MDEKLKKAIIGVLVSSGLLTEKQMEEILAKEEVFRARILKVKGAQSKKGRHRQSDISLLAVIESLRLRSPEGDKALITEELIMKEAAKQLKLPFVKIDQGDCLWQYPRGRRNGYVKNVQPP